MTSPSVAREYDLRAHLRDWLPRPSAEVFGRSADLEVRLASTHADVWRAQRLRYEVFYEEMSARPSPEAKLRRLDQDMYDDFCDHLLVVDRSREGRGSDAATEQCNSQVVGTYRMLRQDVAAANGAHFYTDKEFELGRLIEARPGYRFMELGRSCVHPSYRNKRTLELLWHGLWTYIRRHGVDVMVGCASFEGTDPDAHADALTFLHHHRRAPDDWSCSALQHLRVDMSRRPIEMVDQKIALKGLPPLIKAYLRLGAFVGDGAVIDHEFGTTDILIVLPVERIDPRYFDHYGAPEEKVSRLAQRLPAEA